MITPTKERGSHFLISSLNVIQTEVCLVNQRRAAETCLPWVSGISRGLGRKMESTLKGVIEEDLMKGLFTVKVRVKGTNVGW